MIQEARLIRKKHRNFEIAKMLFSRLEDKYLLALIAERYLKYVYKRDFSEQEVAEYIKVSKFSYRHNKKMALVKLLNHLDFIEHYELARCG